MHRRFRSTCRIGALLVLNLLCLPYSSRYANLPSGSGALPIVFTFNSGGTSGGGNIQAFGPDSLTGNLYFSDSFSSYSETPLPSGLTGVSATIGSGSIVLGLGGYS